MEWHKADALAVAQALEAHPAIARVLYPGLKSHPQHALARQQMSGAGGMLSFDLKGVRQMGIKLVESTRVATLAVSLGSVETLIEHAASMSHPADLIDDLRQTPASP